MSDDGDSSTTPQQRLAAKAEETAVTMTDVPVVEPNVPMQAPTGSVLLSSSAVVEASQPVVSLADRLEDDGDGEEATSHEERDAQDVEQPQMMQDPETIRSSNSNTVVNDESNAPGTGAAETAVTTTTPASAMPAAPVAAATVPGSEVFNRFRSFRQRANQNATALWATRSVGGSGVGSTPPVEGTTTTSPAATTSDPPPTTTTTSTVVPAAGVRLANWARPIRQASLDAPPPPPPPPPRRAASTGTTTTAGSPPPPPCPSPRQNSNSPDKSSNPNDNTQQHDTAGPVFSDHGSNYDSDNNSYYNDDHDHDDGTTSYGDTSSFVDSSVAGTEESGMFRASLLTAANSVLDNAAGIYRGRYSTNGRSNSSNSVLPPVSTGTGTTTIPSQTARILGSRQAGHLQTLMDSLEPFEYVMLLGKGMLGVNLKQGFLKSTGTYVDYLVAHGAADRSGVVTIGDSVMSVGNDNVVKETIWTVPVKIQKAARPVHLVMSVACALPVERVQHLDIAVAMMHQVRRRQGLADNKPGDLSTDSLASNNGLDDSVVTDDASLSIDKRDLETQDRVNVQNESMESDDSMMDLVQPSPSMDIEDTGLTAIDIPIDTVEDFVNPAAPTLAVREAYQFHITKRNNDGFSVTQLCQASADSENFRASLRNAFLTCTIDGRRFSFLARHLVHYEESLTNDDRERSANISAPNAMLMLFLEMVNFSDLYGVTPVSRRRDIAKRIAQKFFLPTKCGSELNPPAFDCHHIVADSSLRRLESALNDKKAELSRDIFVDFQQAVADSLSGKPFISFLVSNECARMRAYLRGTAPFVNVPLEDVFRSLAKKPTDAASKNYFLFLLTYLLCRVDKESGGGEYDIAPGQAGGSRVVDAASGICAALFIRGVLLPAIEDARQSPPDPRVSAALISAFERFWEMFVAPDVGAIEHSSHSNETSEYLKLVRAGLQRIQSQVSDIDDTEDTHNRAVELLVEAELASDIGRLADELTYDYSVNAHPRFRGHKFYEWMCAELAKDSTESTRLPSGCIKRLLRKADFPAGVSAHKPAHLPKGATASKPIARDCNESLVHTNAECALIFGTSVGLDLAAQMPSPAMGDQADLRRYTCQSVVLDDADTVGTIGPDQIPATLESYAVVPPAHPKAFGSFGSDADGVHASSDGWEASFVNFMIPRADTAATADGEEGSLFGVSLVFRRLLSAPTTAPDGEMTTEFAYEESPSGADIGDSTAGTEAGVDSDGSAAGHPRISTAPGGTPKRSNVNSSPPKDEVLNSPIFNGRLQERSWTERISREVREEEASVTVGIVLVSQRNVIFAMKETLVRLLRDSSRGSGALVNILGNFAHQDVEAASLKSILDPFLRSASKPWLERPIAAQKDSFLQLAGQQLIRSLPPVPLALMFVSALMEQKIVLSSSRRSILLSATVALQEMLRPLEWCHLIVPRVPGSLAGDLLQYPAPFILGMPSDDPGIMDLIRDLPNDVTLVDLDVGRVILAPSFAHNSEMGRGTTNNDNTVRALRSQVLYLAQSLGNVFGARIDSSTWLCDEPLLMEHGPTSPAKAESEFDILRATCRGFIEEVLAGTPSCCYWVQEESATGDAPSALATEPTVLFDEDRFFHVKNQRQRNGFHPLLPTITAGQESSPLALGLDDFDLVLEVFLRCQSMNAYVSSRQRDEMMFSL